MSKTAKKDVLGASPDIETTVESPAVDVPGKAKGNSHLDGYKWKPGESGNPSGRPKVDLKPELQAFAGEIDPKTGKTRFRVWLEMADRRARQGSPKHLEMLLAYGWGRPNQAIEVDTTVSYTDALVKARERLTDADETIRRFLASPHAVGGLIAAGWSKPAEATPTNGHSDPETAAIAAAMPEQDLAAAREDDAERPAQPAVERGPIKRVVV